jgi:phenylacetic acid degradation protein
MIYQFKNFIPVIHESSFIHPQAAITGNVIIGKNVYIGPFASLRGDFGKIIVENGCNVQESCTVHMFPGVTVLLKENAHIGHGAVIHGSTIGSSCLIGMNAVVMDNVVLEDECIVGALSFVKADQHIPARSLLVGNPAKIIRKISDEMMAWKSEGTTIYQQLTLDMKNEWKECEPLRSKAPENGNMNLDYKPWDEMKKK